MKIKTDDRTIKKWTPVIEVKFGYKNKYIIDVICMYCEFESIKGLDNGSPLIDNLNKIKEKIDNMEGNEIVSKFLNTISGEISYKLKSGRIIPKDNYYYELTTEELVEIFGTDFIKELNLEEYRNLQIGKII